MSWSPHNNGRRITLPVQKVNGQWELIHGSGVPLPDGALAELSIDLSAVQDEAFKALITQELSVQVLPMGTTLYVALSDRGAGWSQSKTAVHLDIPTNYWPEGATRFEPVTLGPTSADRPDLFDEDGGLWIRHIGLDHSELRSSPIQLPDDFPTPVARSLNHALTLLSEHYEVHRISHTGSVYNKVFYRETNNTWLPLSVLRDGVSRRAEESLLALAWSQLEQKLGWCRVPPAPPEKKRGPRGPGG